MCFLILRWGENHGFRLMSRFHELFLIATVVDHVCWRERVGFVFVWWRRWENWGERKWVRERKKWRVIVSTLAFWFIFPLQYAPFVARGNPWLFSSCLMCDLSSCWMIPTSSSLDLTMYLAGWHPLIVGH